MSKNVRMPLNFLLVCILAGAASAFAQEAESALKQFEGKILMLRHPVEGRSPRYDSQGKLLKDGTEGPWTVYGGVLIDKVHLKSDKLRLEGHRVLFPFPKGQLSAMIFKPFQDRLTGPPFPPALTLEVALDHPIDSAEQAQNILSSVFALNTADLLDSLPDYWREYLQDRLAYDPSQKREEEFHWRDLPYNDPKPGLHAEPQTISESDGSNSVQPILHIGPEVKAPKAQFTPEPEFSEIARYEKFPGVTVVSMVVDSKGVVRRIRIVRPLGLGLDENARAKLQTWRFQPAMRNGEPVAVELNVEVSFNLY